MKRFITKAPKSKVFSTQTSIPYRPYLKDSKLVGIGIAASSFGSMSGVGSGIALVPLLSKFTDLSRHQCTAASLFGVTVNCIASSLSFVYMGVHVDVVAALTIGIVAAVSANFGAKFNKRMDPRHLTLYFAFLALFVGLFVPLYGQYKKNAERKESSNRAILIAVAGAVCGFISGLLGIGGSLFYVPVLMSTTALPHVSVIGTALLSCLLPSLSGTITHYRIGNLDLKKGFVIAAGTATGIVYLYSNI